MLLDFQAIALDGATIELRPGVGSGDRSPLAVVAGDRILVSTGVADFAISKGGFPFEQVSFRGRPAVDVQRCGLFVTESSGRVSAARIISVDLEENGPVRAVVRIDARLGGDRDLQVRTRLYFFAGKSAVKMDLTLRNPRAARHRGGFWELGDAGSIYVTEASLRLAVPREETPLRVRCSPTVEASLSDYAVPFTLYQDSSGGENWRSSTHINRKGHVPMSFRGYRLEAPGVQISGLRATPLVQLAGARSALAVAIPAFWENFPKAIHVTDGAIEVGMFPAAYSDVHEIQGGEQKTQTIWVAIGQDETTEPPLEWCRCPSRAIIPPQWCAETRAIPFLLAKEDDPNSEYLNLVDQAIEGHSSFFIKRETIDEYGWRDFGEVYADHEAVFHQGTQPLVSHYNNQYDAVAGFAYQWLRSGDTKWWTLMNDLAHHVVDIDIYHTDADWPKYNHGLFWHTVHYVDAGTSTHRTYPKDNGVHGGGPSAGHLYTTGLMLHYFLTGERASLDAVIELGGFTVDSDDGRRSVFRWIDGGRTGHISDSIDGYHGPGRAPANALNALLDAHRVTNQTRFLVKAEELIRRCIHPADDIDARHLLDAERRWFYTMFLQSLGKYLLTKRELGQVDGMYAYAQHSLLAYARWMAIHERPYLEHPEILEYPTETWAAQDMRKCEVFQWAVVHATGSERATFSERARFFFDYAVNTLSGMNTRTLARPVILLLSYGWARAAFARETIEHGPVATVRDSFGSPQQFVPQKARAVRKVKRIGAVVLATLITLASWWLLAVV